MAKKEVVELIDDIDGSRADSTVRFGLDGNSYEIDLNSTNAEALRQELSKYVERARRVGRSGAGVRRAMRTSTPSRATGKPSDVREWAREHGYEISERGRIPSNVLEAYAAAH